MHIADNLRIDGDGLDWPLPISEIYVLIAIV